MAHQGSIEIDGQVREVLPNTLFRVEIEGGKVILCHLSGKMRIYFIKIMPGDKVRVDPAHEKQGIGRTLHDTMLDWYFWQTKTTVWLGTAYNTRAEGFYRKAGWKEVGTHGPKEIKFEMRYEDWYANKKS